MSESANPASQTRELEDKGKGRAPDQPQDVSMDEDDDSSDTGAEEEVCFLRPCLWSSMGQPD